jgi:hypothetical protein
MDEVRQVVFESIPYRFEIDAEVFVNKLISNADYFVPWNFWMGFTEIVRYTTSSFAHDLQRKNYCILHNFIRLEFFSAHLLNIF